MEDIINIKIPVFEGRSIFFTPDQENKLDIDIPISVITSQYLEYIEIMKELNLEIAGDFLVMAATLIQIKSRMLLPPDEEAAAEEQEDPRLDLVQRLDSNMELR
jgi:segregation and condensation protein A